MLRPVKQERVGIIPFAAIFAGIQGFQDVFPVTMMRPMPASKDAAGTGSDALLCRLRY